MNLRKVSRGKFGNFVIWVVVIGFGLGVMLLFTPNLTSSLNQNTTSQNEAAIVIKGEEITQGDFNVAYNNLVQNYTRFYQQFGQDYTQRLQGASGAYNQLELRSQVADQLIRQKLLEQEVKQRSVSVPAGEIETSFQVQFDQTLSENNLTEQEADDILRQQGSSVRQFKTDLRNQISEQLKQDKLKEVVIGDLVPTDEQIIEFVEENKSNYQNSTDAEDPTEEEIQRYYDENQNEYLQVKARHILVSVDENAPEEELNAAREKIDAIKQRLNDGEDFIDIATYESDDASAAAKGGDLGFFGTGAMVKPFEEVAFAMEPGEVSDPVKTKFGFHIIRVEEKKSQPFEEVKTQIKDALSNERSQGALDDLIEKAKAEDAEALSKLREAAEDDYVSQKGDEKFEQWVEEITATAAIEIKLPEVVAFRMEADNPDDALAAYENIKAEGLNADPYLDYYIGQLYKKRHSEALTQLKTLQDKEELTAEEEQQLQTLTEQVESARKKAAESLLAVAERGGNSSDIELFDEVVNLGETTPALHYSYALAKLQSDDRSGALAQLKEAINLDDTYAPALTLYGDLMIEQSNFGIAAENYEKALAVSDAGSRNEKNVRLKLAQAYTGSEKFAESQELFEVVLATDAKNTSALTGLGDLFFAQEDYENANGYFKQALEVSPRAAIRVKLGNTYLELNQLEEAKRSYEQAQQQEPYGVDSYRGLGRVYEAQGNVDKALEQYREGALRARGYEQGRDMSELILSLDPEDLTTRFRLANLYKTQHVFQKSIDHYNIILEQDPNSLAAYWGLAESYDGRADYETAKVYYKSALAIEASIDDQIKTYDSIYSVERKIVGFQSVPGPDGLDALYNLARLNLEKGSSQDMETAQGYLDDLTGYDDQYRTEDVAALQQQIEERIANKPGEAVEDMGAAHVAEGAEHDAYNSTPPTSGPHYGRTTDWGIYSTAIADELQGHNLEHSGVFVQYRPDLEEETVKELVDLVREMGPTYKKLILAPYPGLDTAIALTAWNRIDKLERFDADRIRAFTAEYIDQGPEKIAFSGAEWWLQTPSSDVEGNE